MVRAIPITALFVILLALVIDAQRDSEKNARTKDIISLGNCTLSLLENRFLSRERELAEIPYEWRQENWGTGSCVHATSITLLNWQGEYEAAAEWKRLYSGGEATAQSPHTNKMDHLGLKYVVTNDGDEDFIQWALESRRGCGVACPRGHCVAWVGLTEHDGQRWITVLDNNHVDTPHEEEYSTLLRKWQNHGGHAFAFTGGKVPPPRPKLVAKI